MWINKQIAYDRYQKYVKYSVSCITTIVFISWMMLAVKLVDTSDSYKNNELYWVPYFFKCFLIFT